MVFVRQIRVLLLSIHIKLTRIDLAVNYAPLPCYQLIVLTNSIAKVDKYWLCIG
jgi:hypothetical protein